MSLFGLITFYLDKDEKSGVNNYYNQLQIIADNSDNKHIVLYYKLAKALILKSSKRSRKKAQAEDSLQKIIEDEIFDHELTVLAMKHYIELLLIELKSFGEEEVFDEAVALIGKLLVIAQEQKSLTLIVETMLLRSKFALIKGDVDKANEYLEQAEINAEEYNLTALHKQVQDERAALNEDMEKWRDLVDKGASMFERIEQANMINYIKQMQKLNI